MFWAEILLQMLTPSRMRNHTNFELKCLDARDSCKSCYACRATPLCCPQGTALAGQMTGSANVIVGICAEGTLRFQTLRQRRFLRSGPRRAKQILRKSHTMMLFADYSLRSAQCLGHAQAGGTALSGAVLEERLGAEPRECRCGFLSIAVPESKRCLAVRMGGGFCPRS